jgi:hypothetical protein
MGAQTYPANFHYAVFNHASLRKIWRRSAFATYPAGPTTNTPRRRSRTAQPCGSPLRRASTLSA